MVAAPVYKIQERVLERKDDDHSYLIGDSGWYEPYTTDRQRLFRSLQREHGRCVGKMYNETRSGKVTAIGWVFEKREQYEDSYGCPAQYYMREVWVAVAPDAWGGGI